MLHGARGRHPRLREVVFRPPRVEAADGAVAGAADALIGPALPAVHVRLRS